MATLTGGATATTGAGLLCLWATTAADMVNAADGADAESDPTGFDPITDDFDRIVYFGCSGTILLKAS